MIPAGETSAGAIFGSAEQSRRARRQRLIRTRTSHYDALNQDWMLFQHWTGVTNSYTLQVTMYGDLYPAGALTPM
jgi:hypothetical protein